MAVFTVDFGHTLTGGDTGARGNGIVEEQKTREIGNLVVIGLRNYGHIVHVIQLEHAKSMVESLNYRVNRILEIQPDQSISIHINDATNKNATGVEVWGDNLCKDKCIRICNNISKEFRLENRGFKNGCESLALVGLYGSSNIPALLVECFFICNSKDCSKYNAQKYADAIVAGILNKPMQVKENNKSEDDIMFNEKWYLKENPSVKAAVDKKQFASGRDHYNKHGKKENRRTVPRLPLDFNEGIYLLANSDIKNAVDKNQYDNGAHHWLLNGWCENRTYCMPEGWCDDEYLALNPGLKEAIVRDKLTAKEHYIKYGRKEKRPYKK